jgi:hypothetical protein
MRESEYVSQRFVYIILEKALTSLAKIVSSHHTESIKIIDRRLAESKQIFYGSHD